MNYGLRKGFFGIEGQLTTSGNTRAEVLGVFGEAELAELRIMLSKEDVGFAKAA